MLTRAWAPGPGFSFSAGLGLVGGVPPCLCMPQSHAFFEVCKQKCLNAVQ